MDHPLTIAWVIQGDEVYGVRAAVLNLAKGIAGFGHRPVFASMDDGPFAAELRTLGYPVVIIGRGTPTTLSGGLARRLYLAGVAALLSSRRAAAVAERLWELKPHAVHVLWPTLLSIAAKAALRLRVPCIWEMPNTVSSVYPFRLNRRLYCSICRRGGVMVLANSDYTGRTLADGRVRPITFHLAVDTPRFDPVGVRARTRESLGLPADAHVFAIAARVDEQKGQLPFLQGLLAVDKPGPERHLLLLGGPVDGPVAQAMKQLAAKHDASDRLHFAGVVTDPETYYPLIDVAVNSRVDAEPFGLSVVEAMMMGRPVLVHALGGPAETVLDGQTGWHCDGPSPPSWTRSIERVLNDSARWPEMGRAAREYALAHFSVETVSERYLGLVRGAIAGRR